MLCKSKELGYVKLKMAISYWNLACYFVEESAELCLMIFLFGEIISIKMVGRMNWALVFLPLWLSPFPLRRGNICNAKYKALL